MKRRGNATNNKIHLIAEDKTGEFVFKEIIRKKDIAVRVVAYGKAVGVSTLAREIKGLLATILRKSSAQDCIIVLYDTDISVQTDREHYQKIAQICKSHGERVTRLEAVQEIESWLLADKGFCRWLDEHARASDHIPQPSKKLESLINDKFGRSMWTNLNKPKLLQQHMDASGDKLSESMHVSMEVIKKLPCIQALNQP